MRYLYGVIAVTLLFVASPVFAFVVGDWVDVSIPSCNEVLSSGRYEYQEDLYDSQWVYFVSVENSDHILYYYGSQWILGEAYVSNDFSKYAVLDVPLMILGEYSGCEPAYVSLGNIQETATAVVVAVNNVSFGLAVLIVLMFTMVVGFMFNSFKKRK